MGESDFNKFLNLLTQQQGVIVVKGGEGPRGA